MKTVKTNTLWSFNDTEKPSSGPRNPERHRPRFAAQSSRLFDGDHSGSGTDFRGSTGRSSLAQNRHSGSRLTHVVIKHRRCGAARPRPRGAWHRGAAPGCCRANRVATPRYPGDQPIDPHSDADAPPNVQHPEDMADRRVLTRGHGLCPESTISGGETARSCCSFNFLAIREDSVGNRNHIRLILQNGRRRTGD
jgi:hypothetical protein